MSEPDKNQPLISSVDKNSYLLIQVCNYALENKSAVTIIKLQAKLDYEILMNTGSLFAPSGNTPLEVVGGNPESVGSTQLVVPVPILWRNTYTCTKRMYY